MTEEYDCNGTKQEIETSKEVAKKVEKACRSFKNEKRQECENDLNQFKQNIQEAEEEAQFKCKK